MTSIFFVMKKGHGWKKLFRVANLSTFLIFLLLRPKTGGGGVQVGFGTWLGQVYPRSTLYVNNLEGIHFHDGKELERRGGIGHHHM